MRLGIVFQGECRNKDNVVRAVQRMAKEKGYRVGAWKEGMRVVLCPTGYVDLGWVPVRSFFGRWKITGSCVSVPAGPGFHRAAAELIQALGEKEIKDMEWKDSTGYLEDPDFEALRRDTFEPWLAEQLNQALEELDRDPEGEVRLFWDEDQYWPEKVPGTVVTPVGRFSRPWLAERLEQGALRELSERMFLWNEPGHDARFHRNCALKRLWEDCYFAPSDRAERTPRSTALFWMNWKRRPRWIRSSPCRWRPIGSCASWTTGASACRRTSRSWRRSSPPATTRGR